MLRSFIDQASNNGFENMFRAMRTRALIL